MDASSFKRRRLEQDDHSDYATTRITDWTFKPLIKECLSELVDDPTACDNMAHWDTGRVTDCSLLFWEALNPDSHDYKLSPGAEIFNVDLSHWNTSSCTTMKSMFHGAYAFNQPIGNWKTGKVHDMSHMFQGATSFSQDISQWDTSNVTNMAHMFRYASNFHNDRLDWNTAKVQQFSYMFLDTTAFDGYINHWNIRAASDTNGHLGLVAMFDGAKGFNQPLDQWDVSKMSKFSFMFQSALKFNQDLTAWDIRGATDFTGMFHGAREFNQTLCWDLTNRTAGTVKMDKILEGTVEDSMLDADFACLVEKQKHKTFPPLPTGSGSGAHGTEETSSNGNPPQETAATMMENLGHEKESKESHGGSNDNNSQPGVRWHLVGIALAVMAIVVLAVRLKRQKAQLGAAHEKEFLDHSNKDMFQEQHGGQERFEDEPTMVSDHNRRKSRSRSEDHIDEHAPKAGEIDFSVDGPVDIFGETFSHGNPNDDDDDEGNAALSLEEAVNAMEAAALGRRTELEKANSKRQMRESMKRMKSLRRQQSLKSTGSQHGMSTQTPQDYLDDGQEISFDGEHHHQAIWGSDHHELGSVGSQNVLQSTLQEEDHEMELEHAVLAMETFMRAEQPTIGTISVPNPTLFQATVDVDAMQDESALGRSALGRSELGESADC